MLVVEQWYVDISSSGQSQLNLLSNFQDVGSFRVKRLDPDLILETIGMGAGLSYLFP